MLRGIVCRLFLRLVLAWLLYFTQGQDVFFFCFFPQPHTCKFQKRKCIQIKKMYSVFWVHPNVRLLTTTLAAARVCKWKVSALALLWELQYCSALSIMYNALCTTQDCKKLCLCSVWTKMQNLSEDFQFSFHIQKDKWPCFKSIHSTRASHHNMSLFRHESQLCLHSEHGVLSESV